MEKDISKPRRYVITGGPGVGKALIFKKLKHLGHKCSRGEMARDIYRKFKNRLGRHLEVGDRRKYSLSVLNAFIEEYCLHKTGLYFFNRGIPDGLGWDRVFGLEASKKLMSAIRAYRYDGIFILDPIESFEDETDVVWASEREAQRVHQHIIQGYIDVGYDPIYVPSDFVESRVQFILSNL